MKASPRAIFRSLLFERPSLVLAYLQEDLHDMLNNSVKIIVEEDKAKGKYVDTLSENATEKSSDLLLSVLLVIRSFLAHLSYDDRI
ncbi:hypothetical protein F5Y12DRAFT_711648 [Xylaria sp. FL1777]|nr:hypothetical protein F5Y12DRAFT_711648 [Xylaria sp. FL1777]